jgi:hypothetical protein
MYDQRINMAQVNVEENDVLEIMDKVYEYANGITPQKDQAKNLKEQILEKYQEYREAITRAYENHEEK